jgi:hypothetical protein
MKTFKDKSGREWTLTINTNAIKRVRDLAKFDLLKITEGREFFASLADPFTLVNVLYTLCKPDADAAKITDEQFGEAMDGDSLEMASTVMLEELTDFFPSRQRKPLKLALEKAYQMQEQSAEIVIERLESPELTEEIMRAVKAAVALPLQTSGNISGTPPE